MTHGRKPRKPRVINADVFKFVRLRATRLVEAEVQDTLHPTRICLDHLREGVATEDEHTVIVTAMKISMGIEERGIVRGLREHIAAAQTALDKIRARALATGVWKPTALYFDELDALREAVHFHEFQLRQVSAGELNEISRKLIAQTLSSGGACVYTDLKSLGLAAA